MTDTATSDSHWKPRSRGQNKYQCRFKRQGACYEGGSFDTSDEACFKRDTMLKALDAVGVGSCVTEDQLAQLWEIDPVRHAACAAECATAWPVQVLGHVNTRVASDWLTG